MDSVSEGRKGDILALYGLCMLFEKHVVVHLHNGVMWSTLAELSMEHIQDIEKCDMHLCYLGRGLFVELVKRDVPLQILDDTKDNVKSVVVGELAVKEVTTIDKKIPTGSLGVALDSNAAGHSKSMVSTASASAECEDDLPRVKLELKQPKPAASTSVYNKQKCPITKELLVVLTLLPTCNPQQQSSEPDPEPKTASVPAISKELKIVLTPLPSPKVKPSSTQGSRDNETTADLSVKPKEVRICLYKLILDNPSQQIIVTQKMLDHLVKSKYRLDDYLETLTPEYEAPHTEKYGTDATIASSSSVSYWPLDRDQQICMFPKIMPSDHADTKKIQRGELLWPNQA